MATRKEYSSRPGRESLSKRLGKIARAIKARDGFACVYCGATEATSGAHLHLDHLVPRSAGGEVALAGLRILEMPGQGRRFGVYLPADERGRHEFVVGPYEDEDGGAR